MDKIASELYTFVLRTLRRGHALWVPEPNEELTAEYRQTGVRIGDVGILRDNGSFDFIFNVCCSADDPVNQYGVPADFETLSWNGAKRRTSNIFRPGEPVLSRGAKKQALGVEGTASVPGIPVGAGAGLSIKFSKDQGAVIIPPNGADSVDCQNLAVFRSYAERHAVSWYSFVNEELGMEVENGAIYFVTGFDKTDCWENAVFSHSSKERTFEIIVNTGGLAGGDGRLHLSDSSLCEAYQSRCSPAHNLDRNQALFVRGFRISMHRKLKTLLWGSPVEVSSTYDSFWKEIRQRSSQFPFRRRRSSSSGSRSPSCGSGSSRGTSSSSSSSVYSELSDDSDASDVGYDSDTSLEEDAIEPLPEVYDPSQVINDHILECISGRDDVKVVITHDEDWFALLSDEDDEMPDEEELLRRLKDLLRVTVKDDCASLEHVETSFDDPCVVDTDDDLHTNYIIGSSLGDDQNLSECSAHLHPSAYPSTGYLFPSPSCPPPLGSLYLGDVSPLEASDVGRSSSTCFTDIVDYSSFNRTQGKLRSIKTLDPSIDDGNAATVFGSLASYPLASERWNRSYGYSRSRFHIPDTSLYWDAWRRPQSTRSSEITSMLQDPGFVAWLLDVFSVAKAEDYGQQSWVPSISRPGFYDSRPRSCDSWGMPATWPPVSSLPICDPYHSILRRSNKMQVDNSPVVANIAYDKSFRTRRSRYSTLDDQIWDLLVNELSSLPSPSSLPNSISLPCGRHQSSEQRCCRMQCRINGQTKPEEDTDSSLAEVLHETSHGCGSCDQCKFSTSTSRVLTSGSVLTSDPDRHQSSEQRRCRMQCRINSQTKPEEDTDGSLAEVSHEHSHGCGYCDQCKFSTSTSRVQTPGSIFTSDSVSTEGVETESLVDVPPEPEHLTITNGNATEI